jgi:two-component system, cell cycle sensor histidine kinase and response regulator CckA
MNLLQWLGFRQRKPVHPDDPEVQAIVEGKVRSLYNELEDGYYEIRPDGQFVFFNKYFARLTGYRPNDLQGRTFYDLLTGDCREDVAATVQKIHRTGLPIDSLGLTIRRRDGARRIFEASAAPRERITPDRQTVVCGIIRDITDQKERDDSLQLSVSAMTMTNTPMIIIDPSNLNTITYCNPAFEEMAGYDRNEIIGKYYTMLYGPETDIRTAEILRLALEEERECQAIIKCYRKDETSFWNDVSFSPVRDSNGRLTHIIGIMADLTQKIEHVYALRENEERFRMLIEHSSDVVSVLAEDGTILYESPAVKRVLGVSNVKQRIEHNWFDYIHPGDRRQMSAHFRVFVGNPGAAQQFTFRIQHTDGSWRVLESVGFNALNDAKINGIILNSRDITDRVAAEKALHQSEERLQLFFDEDLTGDYVLSRDGVILACNTAYSRILGYESVKDVLNTNIRTYYADPNAHERILARVQEEKRIEGMELEFRRRDGTSVYVIQNLGGRFDKKDNLIEMKGYMFDITERKKLEQHIITAHKLESLGMLAAGVSHDFNNILSILDGCLSMIKSRVGESTALKYISMGEHAVRRGAGIADRLLMFSRSDYPKEGQFELDDLVEELTGGSGQKIDEYFSVQTNLEKNLPVLQGDRGQIFQALYNVYTNARDAILDPRRTSDRRGRITINAKCLNGGMVRETFRDADRNRYIRITVEDNGIGMSEGIRRHIFDPFYTTKNNGTATGLGLAVVYGIVENHAGYIDVHSEEGRGTIVDIFLPAGSGRAPTDGPVPHPGNPGGNETILVVEDEDMMRTIVAEVLRSNGYTVLEARDGSEGYETFKNNSSGIDAVVLDLGLPVMTGQELLVKMRELNDSVPVIIASGFSDTEFRKSHRNNGVSAYLQKPYKPDDVLTILRKVLDPVS